MAPVDPRRKCTVPKMGLEGALWWGGGWPTLEPLHSWRLTVCDSLCRLGKNKITSEGGKCLALAVKNSKSISDVG